MMYYEILKLLDGFSLRISILDLGASFVVEVNDGHADNGLIYFVEALVVLIHYFFHKQRFSFELFVKIGDELFGVICRVFVLRCKSIGFDGHVEFFEQIMGDVVVGIVFEIGFVRLVGVQIYLGVLEDFERLFESTWDLLADQI